MNIKIMSLAASVLICVLLLGIWIFTFNSTGGKITEYWTIQSDANDDYYAVSISEGKKQATIIYDINKDYWIKLSDLDYHISFPKFSMIRNSVLFLTARKIESSLRKIDEKRDLENTILLKCDIVKLNCERLFSSPYLLANPIDLTDGSLIISAGKPNEWADHADPDFVKIVYNDNDLYYVSSALSASRLTDWGLGRFGNVSLTKHGIVFNASSSAYTKESIRDSISHYETKSDIYQASIISSPRGTIINRASDEDFLRPWVSFGRNLDTRYSTIFEETAVAMLSAVNRNGQGWRYDAIVIDPVTNSEILRLIPKSNQSFIEPELINENTLLVGERFGGEIRLHRAKLSDKSKSTLSFITKGAISNMASAIAFTKIFQNARDVPVVRFSEAEQALRNF